MKSRTESRSPMFSWVYSVPRGSMALTPLATRRAARGMSAVTARSPGTAFSAMWSSATSGPPSTLTAVTKGLLAGVCMRWLATSRVAISRRSAALATMSFTSLGAASASTQILMSGSA